MKCASEAELRSCLIEIGSSIDRMSIVPATIIWNYGSPGEVFTNASIHAPSATTQ